MKIKIDKDKCIGCGTCVVIAPKTFKLSDDGKSQVIDLPAGKAGPPRDDKETIRNAVDSCPVVAIELAD